MASKKNSMNLFFVIGCALTVIGFCLPIFKLTTFGKVVASVNGFTIIKNCNTSNATLQMICTILILAGAVLGIVFDFVTKKKFLPEVVAIAISIVGGIIIFTNTSDIGVSIAKNFISLGFYLIIAGWVVAVIGLLLNKFKK